MAFSLLRRRRCPCFLWPSVCASSPETRGSPSWTRLFTPGLLLQGGPQICWEKRLDWTKLISTQFSASETVCRRESYRIEVNQGSLQHHFKEFLIAGLIIITAGSKSCWEIKFDNACKPVHSKSTANADDCRYQISAKHLYLKVMCSFKVLLVFTVVNLV